MGFLAKLFGTSDVEDFPRTVYDALRAEGVTDSIAFDAATFSLRIGDGIGSRAVHLGNLQARYVREQRPDREELLRAFVRRYRGSAQAPKSFRDAQQRLLPQVRNRCDFSFSNLSARANGIERDDRPFRLVSEEIGIGLVLDEGEMTRGVDHALLQAWGVGEDEALRVALDNLRARTEPQFEQHSPGVWISAWRDGYDATRILVPDILSELPIRGRPVIVIPHANLLAVTGDQDSAGLAVAATLAPSAFEHGQPISVTPLIREGDSWRELHLDDSALGATPMALTRLKMSVQQYDRQQELLAAVAIRDNDETFVAPYVGTRDRESGAFFSYTPWSEWLKQSLPRTDRVRFVSDDKSLGLVEWVDVLRVMGAAIQPTADYPPRYIVETFPTEAQLRDMGLSSADRA